jgi:hypothetical protein
VQVWSNAGMGTPQNTHKDLIQNGCQVGIQMHHGAIIAWPQAVQDFTSGSHQGLPVALSSS